MASYGTMSVTGKSGRKYNFNMYSADASFKMLGGVYIVTKRVPKQGGGGNHTFLYVGQTDDLSTRFGDHHKQSCFDKKGANCIGVHRDDDEESRLAKEDDLLKGHDWPCND